MKTLDIRNQGAGKTIHRKYWVENGDFEPIDNGWCLHKVVMCKDNPYRMGAELSDCKLRLMGHIKSAYLTAGGKQLNPPQHIVIKIN